jgi:hypothetical protein
MTPVDTQNTDSLPTVNRGKTASKQRVRRNLPSLPSLPGASGMQEVTYTCKVDSTPTSWESLPLYSPFSLSSDGSYPLLKVTKSKACDIRTGKSLAVGSGRCYRVMF